MARKFANLYAESKTNSRTGHRQWIYGKDGTLFSCGIYPTKITAEDLPEWYVYGRIPYNHSCLNWARSSLDSGSQ